MADICRICMEATEDTLPMATIRTEDEIEVLNLGLMFENCFGITVTEIPEFIKLCMTCKIQLTYYYDFKKLVLKNHNELLKLTQPQHQQEDPVEEETETENKVFLLNDVLNADCSDFIIDEENIEYLEEDINVDDVKNVLRLDDAENAISEEHLACKDEILDESETIEQEGENATHNELEHYEVNEVDMGTDIDEMEKPSKSSKIRWKRLCSLCGKKFRNKDIYNAHMNVHQGLPAYSCSICQRDFKHKVNFDYHMKNHNNYRTFECTVDGCSKTCLSGWDLKVHMRTHTDLRPYSCEICGRGFRVKSHVTEHMETHATDKVYECSMCLQKYKTRASLKIHVTTIHMKQHQYVCLICGKVFYRNHHLKVHLKVHERSLRDG